MHTEIGFNAGISEKVAVVSGGASGIGRACAELLSTSGAKVAVFDIDVAAGQGTAKGIIEQGGQAIFINCDVSQNQS